MRISITTFTIILSTFSSCLATSGAKHDIKLGMRRHIITSRRSTGEQETSPNSRSSEGQPIMEPKASEPSNSVHQHEKRAYYGQGTYFQPGEGKSYVLSDSNRLSRLTSSCTGACGWYADASQHIAALNSQQYGDMGRKSSHCGSWIRITNRQTGASTKAQVQGKHIFTLSAGARTDMQSLQMRAQAAAMVVSICRLRHLMISHLGAKV